MLLRFISLLRTFVLGNLLINYLVMHLWNALVDELGQLLALRVRHFAISRTVLEGIRLNALGEEQSLRWTMFSIAVMWVVMRMWMLLILQHFLELLLHRLFCR